MLSTNKILSKFNNIFFRCTLENFKLVILDKNDNSPYFTQCKNFNLSESTKIGEIVSKVLAKDSDFIMDEISYSYGKNYKVCIN